MHLLLVYRHGPRQFEEVNAQGRAGIERVYQGDAAGQDGEGEEGEYDAKPKTESEARHVEGKSSEVMARVCSMLAPDNALMVRRYWLDKIIAGEKVIEIRNTKHNKEGYIYLVETKSGGVRATAYLGASRELTVAELEENQEGNAAMSYTTPYAWPLREVVALPLPWTMSPMARRYCPRWVPRARWERYPTSTDPEMPTSASATTPTGSSSGSRKWAVGALRDAN